MSGACILIIDDEPGIRRTLASILEDEKYRVFTAEDAIIGREILDKEKIDLVFLDVLLPRQGGLEALEQMRQENKETEVIMISGHANVDMAVRAVKLGAFDFLEKPVSLDRVLTVLRNALAIKQLREENRNLRTAAVPHIEILGVTPEINEIRKLAEQAAASDARILIIGENGTGKEVIARTIHRLSGRSGKPFIEVNCAAIPDTLIESELFGHEKGAFTDAHSTRKGRFETASGGTLFLDEIGDMSLAAQAKVLRVIQEQKIQRLGGEKTIDVDVRILAATNQDLEQAAGKGLFRQDLFFRLNVIPIKLPPLRDRKPDIPILLHHFYKQLSSEELEIEESAIALLTAHHWPGNIRELKNFAERLGIMFPGSRVTEETVSVLLNIKPEHWGIDSSGISEKNIYSDPAVKELLDKNLNQAKEDFEKLYLELHLSRNNGIISKTAEAIGIYPSNLHAKLRKYGIKAGT
ncbi:MAG: sigma-54 dependent transcriptional regulator [Treponema sp.]|jgi:two-component system nitrogen regulation response regulator NtrX|nr:sigma-54 dependent transcriptional regulator [Treponema sp.]